MNSCIVAIGTANPKYKVSQNTIFEFMSTAHQLAANDKERLRKIYLQSGIETRHSVIPDFGKPFGAYQFFPNNEFLNPFPTTQDRLKIYEKEAINICIQAVKNCMDKCDGLKLSEITHLITVSCTGMHAPGIDIELVEKLGLAKNTERTCINFMGCYGAFNALKYADYICQTNSNANVLIVDVELCTLHFQKENTLNNWVANAIFADGAAAVIVQPERIGSKGLRLTKFYSELISSARDDMAWRIGDYGFEMKLSSKIAKKIKGEIFTIASKLLDKASISYDDIDFFAIHPGGRRILEVCEEEFSRFDNLNKHAYEILKKYGNMSSVTILFVLELMLSELMEEDKNKKIVSFAFGPGLTFESVLLETL